MTNRIRKLIEVKKETKNLPKCLVVSNKIQKWVSINYGGERLVWKWHDDKLITPGNDDGIEVSPLSASCVIKEDIEHIMAMDGITDIIYVDQNGEKTNGPFLIPTSIENEPLIEEKNAYLMQVYSDYVSNHFNLSEETIVNCQKFGILKDFLTLVNM